MNCVKSRGEGSDWPSPSPPPLCLRVTFFTLCLLGLKCFLSSLVLSNNPQAITINLSNFRSKSSRLQAPSGSWILANLNFSVITHASNRQQFLFFVHSKKTFCANRKFITIINDLERQRTSKSRNFYVHAAFLFCSRKRKCTHGKTVVLFRGKHAGEKKKSLSEYIYVMYVWLTKVFIHETFMCFGIII